MLTPCSADLFDFAPVEGRRVEAGIDGGTITSDAGALLLGATDRVVGLVGRLAGCFVDARRPDLIEHDVATLIAQRVFGIALGYEDLNDHEHLRHDPAMAVLAGKLVARRSDCAPVAGKSTLNRLELSRPEPTRYHKIAHDEAAIERLFVELFLEAHANPPKQIVARIRTRWPRVRILLRADSGFAREALMAWCEKNRVDYVFGLARNDRLVEEIAVELIQAEEEAARTGKPARRFKDLRWSTRESWSRRRRVIAKAEWTQGEANPRFIVTSLKPGEVTGRHLYEEVYCARGDMENRIKETQGDLFADRTSAATMRANQLRLWFASMAYVLMCALRRIGLPHTQFAEAACGTIRLKLLKLGALVRVSVRRVKFAMASGCPWQNEWALAHARLRNAAAA